MVKDKSLVDMMARSYKQNKIKLNECQMGYGHYSEKDINVSRHIVDHIEMIVRYLNEQDRFIIHHEVILGKTGKWYRDHLSQPSYYRHRKEAYRTFLRNLDA